MEHILICGGAVSSARPTKDSQYRAEVMILWWGDWEEANSNLLFSLEVSTFGPRLAPLGR